ncbi:MAG: Txe/YoeB family addiction module toxin [Candidatus Marinimicrobia bacterium]|nr:Txe/YoeB family addiction module toxin [Candidatus Neomarinimicrobiota bacterium]
MSWELVFTKQAQKDAIKLKKAGLKEKGKKLLEIIQNNPFEKPPPYEKLVGDLAGAYSRRINIQHRLIYQVYQGEKIIKILRLWTHYK